MSGETFQKSLATTKAMRPFVPRPFVPLFDHCVRLAEDNRRRGYAQRASRELFNARKLAQKYGEVP